MSTKKGPFLDLHEIQGGKRIRPMNHQNLIWTGVRRKEVIPMWLKKCTCFLLACVAVFGCLDNLQTTTIETNDGVIFEIKDGVEDSFVGGMRRDSYIAVDSFLNDKSGSQTIPFRTNSDYPYYRVFVSNTSKTSYNITLTDASGKNQLTSSPITLGAAWLADLPVGGLAIC